MTAKDIASVIFDCFLIALNHFIIASCIAMAFFKILFLLYEVHGVEVSQDVKMLCVVGGIFFCIALKFFINLSISPRHPGKLES